MMPHERPKTKSYVAGKDLFLFSVFCIVTKKTDNTGAGKLCGRTHQMVDGVYLLYRLLEDDSTKSYGEEKTNRNSTDNNPVDGFFFDICFPLPNYSPGDRRKCARQGFVWTMTRPCSNSR